MLEIGSRLTLVVVALALVWAAWKVHGITPQAKQRGGGGRQAGGGTPIKERNREVGVLMGAGAGGALMAALPESWIGAAIDWIGIGALVVGLIVCGVIILVDWWWDGRPDRPALVAAMIVPILFVYGVTHLDLVGDLLQDAGGEVAASFGEAADRDRG